MRNWMKVLVCAALLAFTVGCQTFGPSPEQVLANCPEDADGMFVPPAGTLPGPDSKILGRQMAEELRCKEARERVQAKRRARRTFDTKVELSRAEYLPGLAGALDAEERIRTELVAQLRLTYAPLVANVPPEGRVTLDLVADYLRQNPNATLVISGFADEHSDLGQNMALAHERAQNALSYLAAQGIEATRLQALTRGAGESRVTFEVVSKSS